MIDIAKYETYLKDSHKASTTISSYVFALRQLEKLYGDLTPKNLRLYKAYLIENFHPKTVNLRILAVNSYAKMIGKSKLVMPQIKLQQKQFLENVISDADYTFFKNKLNNDKERFWYFVVRFFGATGARISELVQFKAEHISAGYIDIYSKGGKVRRIYIPAALKQETLAWLESIGRSSGYLFVNRSGERMSHRGIAAHLKNLAIKYKLNPDVVYPHSFRHRFAKNFLEKFNDISLLADLMGHESIETTRIYLRRTSTEQQEIVDRIVTW